MKPLDPFHINLEKTTLIEASAGTGKTYTITTLYCRLVAKGFCVESILVVTFTEAAAAELKLRIRDRIFNTLATLLEQPCDNQDDLVDFFRGHEKLSLICRRFKHALTCFDQAAIMTIHSFCLKILKENAFESHTLFDVELMPDRSLFLRQVSYDFFMVHVNNLDTLFLSYLNFRQITPESFAESFGLFISRTDFDCRPRESAFENTFDQYREILKKIHDILLTRSGEIIELIQNHKGIDKKSYSKKNVPAWLEASLLKINQKGVDTFFKMTEKNGDALYKFTRTRMELKTKLGHASPGHEFFDLCDSFLSIYNQFENNLISLKIEFLAFFNKELDKIKKTQGICFFDDLVNDLAKALEREDGVNLQKAVRQTYNTCLIDEFQDTDPRQYDIFSKIFSLQATPFFMIGDPKQAIYAFRGGDIFAYLKASRESDQKFTLEKNYRSAPLLVQGINEVFSARINPFLYESIEFFKVKTPETAKNLLTANKEFVPPLQFSFMKREGLALDKKGFISKDTAAGIIPKSCASDILALLQSDQGLMEKGGKGRDPQKISPEDIAVLVRTNIQAEQIQKALSDLNIPSYLSKTGSVFDSGQAIDLHDILWAVNTPYNRGYIYAALCTSVFGFSSDRIVGLDENEVLFFKWQDRFRKYKQIWETKGFVSMAMGLLHSDEAFLKGNASLDERAMTNFYHLIELISQVCLKKQLSPYYLLKWYARQLFKDLRDESADELRLQSDKKAVAIVTIHKSKGMEYPIVYLPYLWEGQQKSSKENILFHDPDKEYLLTLDLGSKDVETSRLYVETEDRAEQRRLLYVALTRASAMCRIIWGGFKSVETSALGTLVHENGCKDDPLMIKDLEQLLSRAKKSILLQPYTGDVSNQFIDREDEVKRVLSAKKISRDIDACWKMSSFSAIAHSQSPEVFKEKEKVSYNRDKPFITLAKFPKGSGSGDLFHSIFETLDFTMGPEEISKQVQLKFDMFGFLGQDLVQMGETSVKEVLNTMLVSESSGFHLKDIPFSQRFNEMEFAFPVSSFQMSYVQKAFEQSDQKFKTSGYIEKLSLLTAQSFKGFIKGFIDLVVQHQGKWYIIDYKSNYLGDTYDEYSKVAMFDAMSNHHYFLQYHLYLVALHRYLGLRLKDYDYDTHFGGVFYLFIRGMHPEFASQYGVFYDRPAKAAIAYLSDNL